jgi:hypothetical protein
MAHIQKWLEGFIFQQGIPVFYGGTYPTDHVRTASVHKILFHGSRARGSKALIEA